MDALKVITIGLVIGLLFTFTLDSSRYDNPNDDGTNIDRSGEIGGRSIDDEGISGGFKPFQGELVVVPFGEE